jgi:ankyrin repeat protein
MGELEKLIEAARLGIMEDLKAILHRNPELVRERDETGASALHYAAFGGHRDAVRLLVEAGGDINATDAQFSATPAGWAIEYLRTMGGFLRIELSDFAYAIEKGDAEWVARFLERFPALRQARDTQGRTFKALADQAANEKIRRMFDDPEEPNAQRG